MIPVDDPPRHLDPAYVGDRYKISPRSAGEMIRRAVAANVVKKVGKFRFARVSAFDAWIAAGADLEPVRARKGGGR